jgi:hypothetical protein
VTECRLLAVERTDRFGTIDDKKQTFIESTLPATSEAKQTPHRRWPRPFLRMSAVPSA